VEQAGSTTVIAAVPERTLVVDYATGKTELEVRNGPEADDTFALTMDGSKGKLLEVRADLKIDVFGFVGLEGSFGFSTQKQGDSEQLVAVGTAVDARLAAGDVAHVSLNDARFGLFASSGAPGQGKQFGFELSQGSFAAGIDGLAGISADQVLVQYTNTPSSRRLRPTRWLSGSRASRPMWPTSSSSAVIWRSRRWAATSWPRAAMSVLRSRPGRCMCGWLTPTSA
jgi:hypothetical protein